MAPTTEDRHEHSHGPALPPLHHAADEGDLAEAEALIAQGEDVNAIDNLGWSALHEAALNNRDAAVCRLLLQHGADATMWNLYRETPLHMAAANEHAGILDICRALLEHGASAVAADDQKKTPLDVAEERGDLRPREQQAALMALLRTAALADTATVGYGGPAAAAAEGLSDSGGTREGLSIQAAAFLMGLLGTIASLRGYAAGLALLRWPSGSCSPARCAPRRSRC